jgi:hypothetical protein
MAEYSLAFAQALLTAGEAIELRAQASEEEQRAVLYLSLLSCEVTLKALLEKAGYSTPHIRRLSHDLATLLAKTSKCSVFVNGRWSTAAALLSIVVDARFENATLGHLLNAEHRGASRYPGNIRYGNLVRHFPAPVMQVAAQILLGWAKEHGTNIKKP